MPPNGSKLIDKYLGLLPLPARLSGVDEAKYRAHFLTYDIAQIRLAIILTLLPNLLLIFNDHLFLGSSSLFFVIVSFRIFITGVSLLFFFSLKRIKSYLVYDRFMSIWLFLVLFALVSINLTRPDDYYMFVTIDVIYVLMIYVVYLSSFVIQASLAFSATVIDLGMLIFIKDVPDPALRAIIVSFFLANGLGWLMLVLINRARRHEFLSHEAELKVVKENQRLEAERNKQSRLESVGILADAIAVDFRNTISNAMQSLDSARKDLEILNNDAARLKLTEAHSSLRRGNAINNQLLAFTRGGEAKETAINLDLIIRKSVYQCLDGTKITFILNLDHDLWPVTGDSEQVLHAISNIVCFARDDKPKEMKIRARNIVRDIKGGPEPGRFVVTQIEDNGPGIPAARLEHLFDPFDSTRENSISLDLPVAYSIIKKHGGTIDVESIEGGGNIFYVYLPSPDKA